jgi:hypothetical protein
MLYVWMQALDSFISPIPGFEGDIPIPMIPVSARSPSGESASDLSARASAGASKNHVGKCKATVILTPRREPNKTQANQPVGSR